MVIRLLAQAAFGIAFVACGTEVLVEDDGDDSSDGSGNGGAGSTSSGNPATTITVSSTSTGSPGGICGSGVTMFDGAQDACLAASCCAAFEACSSSGENVAGCQACLDGNGAGCEAALECAATSDCYPNSNDCPFGGAWGAPSVDACFAQNCCFESMYCTKGGLDVAACTSCLEAGQADALCAPMIECANMGPLCWLQVGICGSTVTTGDSSTDLCVANECCTELEACSDDGEASEACADCFEAGGGPRCAEAIACMETAGCSST